MKFEYGLYIKVYMCVCVCVCSVMSDSLQSHGLYVTHQATLSMRYPRQEHWSGLPFPSPLQYMDIKFPQEVNGIVNMLEKSPYSKEMNA